jgi:hypothetical protein
MNDIFIDAVKMYNSISFEESKYFGFHSNYNKEVLNEDKQDRKTIIRGKTKYTLSHSGVKIVKKCI